MPKLNLDDELPVMLTCQRVRVGARLVVDRARIGIDEDGQKFIMSLDEMDRSEATKQFCWPRFDGGELHPRMVRALEAEGIET